MQFESKKLRQAAIILKGGGVVIHPTETVYGIAAVWNNEGALGKAARLKNRNLRKPFSILVNQIEQILKIAGWEDEKLKGLLTKIFPAPLTIILPRKIELPLSYWNQFPEIGFRFPDFELCRLLVQEVGEPLITTSANIANQAPPKSAAEIDPTLIAQADLFLDGGDCPLQVPSTVLRFDPVSLEWNVLREGAFSVNMLEDRVNEVYK